MATCKRTKGSVDRLYNSGNDQNLQKQQQEGLFAISHLNEGQKEGEGLPEIVDVLHRPKIVLLVVQHVRDLNKELDDGLEWFLGYAKLISLVVRNLIKKGLAVVHNE